MRRLLIGDRYPHLDNRPRLKAFVLWLEKYGLHDWSCSMTKVLILFLLIIVTFLGKELLWFIFMIGHHEGVTTGAYHLHSKLYNLTDSECPNVTIPGEYLFINGS